MTNNFTATGVSAHVTAKHGDDVALSLSGTFSATIKFQKSINGGLSWDTISTHTSAVSTSLLSESTDRGQTWYRAQCSAFTSGTAVVSITSTSAAEAAQSDAGSYALPEFATDNAFVLAKGSPAANGDIYYNNAQHVVRLYENSTWVSKFKVPGVPGTSYLGLSAATTTNAADSISITASNGSALSALNCGYVVLPSATAAGQLSVFVVTSDVTILLTGAHWGLGTKGDFSNVELRVFAINNAGTLKWGVSNAGQITGSTATVTQASVTGRTIVLVNSALSGDWTYKEMGWFKANFDDTGGAAEDLWAVQTSLGSINVGVPINDMTDFATSTVTSNWTTNTTLNSVARRRGGSKEYIVNLAVSGAPDAANLSLTLPTGDVADLTRMATVVLGKTKLGDGMGLDAGTGSFDVAVWYTNTTTVAIKSLNTEASKNNTFETVTDTTPMTWANGDGLCVNFTVPILGWSAN